MNRTAFFPALVATVMTAALIGNANSQSGSDITQVPTWMNELGAKRIEAGQAANEVTSASSDMAPKVKEINLWDAELEKLRPQYKAIDDATSKHNEDAARQRAAVERHNATCPSVVSSQAQVDRCNGELAPLNAWNRRINENKAQLEGMYRQLNQRRDSMVQRRQQLYTEYQAIKARYDRAKAKLDAANERIRTLEGWISAAKAKCDLLQSQAGRDDVGEALHYCNSMQWDGTGGGRPPLTNPKPPFSVTPN